MKRFLLASAALIAAGTAALPADLPSRKAPPQFSEIAVPMFTWTGFYVGLNAGAAFANNNANGAYAANGFAPAFAPTTYYGFGAANNSSAQFLGGGQLGYNYQFGQFVLGAEADLQWLSGSGNNNAFAARPAVVQPNAYAVVNGGGGNGINYFGTVRARLGYAMDRTLLYVTGGWAYANNRNQNGSVDYYAAGAAPGVPTATFTNGGNGGSRSGYALGAGAEYAITNHWTTKLEYLYVNLGGGGNGAYVSAAPIAAGTSFTTNNRNNNQFSLVRLGVNYKF